MIITHILLSLLIYKKLYFNFLGVSKVFGSLEKSKSQNYFWLESMQILVLKSGYGNLYFELKYCLIERITQFLLHCNKFFTIINCKINIVKVECLKTLSRQSVLTLNQTKDWRNVLIRSTMSQGSSHHESRINSSST